MKQDSENHTVFSFEPDMVIIPAGEFVMGSDPSQDQHARENEQPQHTLYLSTYAIGKFPVTNMQYSVFLRATRHPPPPHWKWWILKYRWPPLRRKTYPAVHVSWYDARAYCQWLADVTGKPYRLPTEAEWEKAARGENAQVYPWGNTWDPTYCNTLETNANEITTPVDTYPQGASPYGLVDVIGNIWEWTSTLWGRDLSAPTYTYPYDATDGRENLAAPEDVRRVLRGVSFYNDQHFARCAARYRYSPHNRFGSVGFRVARDEEDQTHAQI